MTIRYGNPIESIELNRLKGVIGKLYDAVHSSEITKPVVTSESSRRGGLDPIKDYLGRGYKLMEDLSD